MKSQQSGFTLVEIAIVLVIIGLLLGGILKGQELINSAKVKNLANDFRVIPTYIYAYQDKFKSLPGDDAQVRRTCARCATPSRRQRRRQRRDRRHTGTSQHRTDESLLFWQHVRLANLAAGPTDPADATYRPDQRGRRPASAITQRRARRCRSRGMTGTYQVCSARHPRQVREAARHPDGRRQPDGSTGSDARR